MQQTDRVVMVKPGIYQSPHMQFASLHSSQNLQSQIKWISKLFDHKKQSISSLALCLAVGLSSLQGFAVP